MVVGYIRVSTVEQNLARQEDTIQKYKVEKIYSEKVSAKDTNRPELKSMLEYVREGDTIVVHDFSRLARSTKDLLEIVELLEEKGVQLISNKENIDSGTPTGKLMLTMIGAINEFERTNMLERQREGIAIAKEQGKYKGRKGLKIDNFEEHYNKYITRDINKSQLAKILGVSRPTLDKLVKDHQENVRTKDIATPEDATIPIENIKVKEINDMTIDELKDRIRLKERLIKEQQVKETSIIYIDYIKMVDRLKELENK